MTGSANPARGEARVADTVLRPTFAALVAAEEELGPLFALVERTASGQLRLVEMATLFWHCRVDTDLDRDAFNQRLIEQGLAKATPALKAILSQILAGQ